MQVVSVADSDSVQVGSWLQLFQAYSSSLQYTFFLHIVETMYKILNLRKMQLDMITLLM